MTANKQFPFMNKGTVTSSIDDLSSGVYGFHREVYDIKVEGFAYGELVVLNTGNGVANGGEPNMQIITNMDGETATRIKWNGVWGNWRRTDNFGYNTLNSLASGVAEKIKPVRKRTVLLNNTYEISVSLNGIASDDGAPQKWTLYAGQWGKKDIYYAEGIFRVYGSGSEYNNAAVTGKSNEFTSLKVEIDSNNNLKVHTGLQLSYLELEVYY